MSVISNTTVISNFSGIDQIDLLRAVYDEIFIAVEVYEEIQRGIEEGYEFYSDIDCFIYPKHQEGWIRMTSLEGEKEVEFFATLPARLHQGEAASLAIAKNRSWLFLTDDKAARKSAKAHGILVSGTLGCLIAGVDRDLWSLADANLWLRKIIETGFRSPVSDLGDLLEEL